VIEKLIDENQELKESNDEEIERLNDLIMDLNTRKS
jgi:hypothetical protein